MNRNEEYFNLMEELSEQTPSLESSIAKATKKKMKKQMAIRSLTTVAAVFAVFVLLVNVSTPVALAVSKVPIIGELVELVRFSDSLTKAIEKEHIQAVNLKQTENGITAEIDYLIADEKRANIFYRVSSDVHTDLRAHISIKNVGSYSGGGDGGMSGGELRRYSVDFSGNAPENLEIKLMVFDSESVGTLEENSIATFDFVIEFEKEAMGEAKIYNIDKTIEVDGQTITIKSVEVYPTHLGVVVVPAGTNTANLDGLNFYIRTDKDTKFEKIKKGTSMSGLSGVYRFYGESMYFYDAEPVELVITGVEWNEKYDRVPIVDLTTGECTGLPEWIELASAERKGDSMVLSFKAKRGKGCSEYDLFWKNFYGAYTISVDERVVEDCGDGYFMETLTFDISDFPYETIRLDPRYEYTWTPEEEIVIDIQ